MTSPASHVDLQYRNVVIAALGSGRRKENRTGIDTMSTFGQHMRFDLRDGFPLITTKRINWFHIVAENLWFLSGVPHIGFLKKHGIKFWDAWADEDGNVPSAYGNFWRHYPVHSSEGIVQVGRKRGTVGSYPSDLHNDQISWVLDTLRTNPMSRRMVVNAWAPGNAQTSKLPPCHCMFVLNVQEMWGRCDDCNGEATCVGVGCDEEGEQLYPHLNMHLTQRSADIGLGVPYNIAGYAFLLSLFSHLSGLKPGILSHTLVDAHVYTSKQDGTMGGVINPNTKEPYTVEGYDHRPVLRRQIEREPRRMPKLTINPLIKELHQVEALTRDVVTKEGLLEHFKLEGYDPHPPLKMLPAV